MGYHRLNGIKKTENILNVSNRKVRQRTSMKQIIKISIAFVSGMMLAISIGAIALAYVSQETYTAPVDILTHAQKAWIGSLEWCESHGRIDAINPKDKDGTASYYSFQFKPGTFRAYGEKYEIIEKGLNDKTIMEKLKNYDLQRKIVENMINDKSIRWDHEFPDCVKKNGRPPVY